MANYYCDHGAYGLASNRLGLDVPTWGVPQEGDGSATAAATTAGTCSVSVASSTSTAATVSIFGSSAISITASSGATLATNIAAAINASTATTSHAALPGAPQVRNVVYARVTSSTTVEIMSRIGSASLNVLGVVWGGTWSAGQPSNLTFAGGTGGCWGWFINPAAIGASSSISIGSYGAWLYKPYCGTTPTLTDFIYCRTGGGASKTIAMGALSYTHAANYYKNIIFDTNTMWTGDVTTGVLKITTNASANLRVVDPTSTGTASYRALRRGGFEIEVTGSNTALQLGGTQSGNICSEHWSKVTFRDSTTTTGSIQYISTTGNSGARYTRHHEECDHIVTTPKTSIQYKPFHVGQYATDVSCTFRGCYFNFNISGVGDPGSLIDSANFIMPTVLTLQGCTFDGFSSGYTLLSTLHSGWTNDSTAFSVVVDNCSGLKMPASYLGCPTPGMKNMPNQSRHSIAFSNATDSVSPGFRIEDCRGVSEWVPNDPTPFPYLGSTMLGTGLGYSMRVVWLQGVPLDPSHSYESMPMRVFNQLSAATRTFSLSALLPTSLASNQGVRVMFYYTDSLGKSQMISAETFTTSSDVWTNAASYGTYSPRKFVATTAQAVKANSEVVAVVEIYTVAPSSQVNLYFDPEFTIT